jgi:alpha-mannosidase
MKREHQWLLAQRQEIACWLDADQKTLPDTMPEQGSPSLYWKCDDVRIPPSWDLASTMLRTPADSRGLLRQTCRTSASTRVTEISSYNRLHPVVGRTFGVELSGRPIDAEGLLAAPGTPLVQLIHVEPTVREVVSCLDAVLAVVKHVDSPDIAQKLFTAAVRAISGISLPTWTAGYLERIRRHEPIDRVWTPYVDAGGFAAGLGRLTAPDRESLAAASAELRSTLTRLRELDRPRGEATVCAYNHLDLAWLWPSYVTSEHLEASFESAFRVSDQTGLVHVGSSSAIYALLEQVAPDTWSGLTDRVAARQYELVGGMWVEPDCNLLSGESLCRQLLAGQGYLLEKFGLTASVAWLPDTFGFTPALPQILTLAGIDSLFITKLRYADTNPFPASQFRWHGLDGSTTTVFANFGPTGYAGPLEYSAIAESWADLQQRSPGRSLLYSVGFSGGYNPDEQSAETLELLRRSPGLPELRTGCVRDFVDAIDQGDQLPDWRGELYLEAHRGTFTTQGRLKHAHRLAEGALIAAETAVSLCLFATGHVPPALAENVETQWRTLLTNQFHDVVAGTAVSEVSDSAVAKLAECVVQSKLVQETVLDTFDATNPGDPAAGLAAANFCASSRPRHLVLDRQVPHSQQVADGYAVQLEENLSPLFVGAVRPTPPDSHNVSAAGDGLENTYVRVRFGPDGTVSSFRFKPSGTEMVAPGSNRFVAYRDVPAHWDAWELSPWYRDFECENFELTAMDIVDSGPHRASVRLTWRFRNSAVRQVVELWADSPRVDFRTTVDWHERRVLLRNDVHLAFDPTELLSECAFGVVDRPVVRGTRREQAQYEVPVHRFVVAQAASQGLAILNDGRYGLDCSGSTISLGLLRSPVFPDPLSDEGRHEFSLSWYPYPGGWQDGDVVDQAIDLNSPPPCVRPITPIPLVAPRLTGLPVVISALKPAVDGRGVIIRAYEPCGRSGEVRLRLPAGWQPSSEVDLLERDQGPCQFGFTPFQLHSWRVEQPEPKHI